MPLLPESHYCQNATAVRTPLLSAVGRFSQTDKMQLFKINNRLSATALIV
jgi:hypothetical protein